MIVTAALPWYDERLTDLKACVRSLAGLVDRLVALDGGYVRYPGAKPKSPPNQAEAIYATAKEIGIECQILTPEKLWAGQVEKRSYLLALASVRSDWIATLDADHVIHTDAAEARRELESSGVDVIDVAYVTPVNGARSMGKSASGIWHQEQATAPVYVPHLWRTLPGLRVERFHYWYSAMKGGERMWLWCPDEERSMPKVTHHQLRTPYSVEHRCLFRGKRQIMANRAFCNDREMVVRLTGQEDHQPGLPPPEWNYEILPL